ncbi:aminotransferase class I/II-fold pyridoxal phosphate-dependent enzyme [Nakamurella sp. YIM 132087]|uniref:Aminotransferase class I/II-fold pyridoxal phosphate-dependent enzyme n=1 Tax=Nakamurella alba TaxID=2665158 RepID=A0A7K1FJA6_9ACTN|nr:aromatic amino acid transaminase [Nakamurella alba]MTD14146.1 aminotransferase class I/II-fold pyridoxal phosphate-dependent enzyme [Nakamurella alba]
MLSTLGPVLPDPLWAMAGALRADRRDPLDLVVGVYRDETGRTPVMRAVAEAEQRLAARRRPRGYVGPSGSAPFLAAMTDLLLGPAAAAGTVAVQSVAGTGALRVLLELVALASPSATVHLGEPGYVNHRPIAEAAGLRVQGHPSLTPDGRADVPALLEALHRARPGDVVLLQAACHNPTGADPDPAQWREIADAMAALGLVPLVDSAYHGFGEGMAADLAGLRTVVAAAEVALVAASCSKNFGLYAERTGIALVTGGSAAQRAVAGAALQRIARASYSQPPDHGAAVVTEILGDTALRADHTAELESMRRRIMSIRRQLAAAVGPGRWQVVTRHRGMFSVLPMTESERQWLMTEAAVYCAPGGRINVAGLPTGRIPRLAAALTALG